MVQKLKTAAYVAIIAAAVVVIVSALAAPVLMAPIIEDIQIYDSYPATVLKGMFVDEAYLAMYERYPDADESIRVTSIDVNIDVLVSDPDTGNTLLMWVYADPYSSVPQTGADCWDSDENIIYDSTGMYTVEFIRTTDCVQSP